MDVLRRADLRVCPPAGDHPSIVSGQPESAVRDIHVSLDCSTPCWNDTIEELY